MTLSPLIQLEDAEFARTAAIKAKQNVELELGDVQTQLDDIMRSKSDLEDRLLRTCRERADLSTQLEDNEEELQEVMKKYKASVSQLSVDQVRKRKQRICLDFPDFHNFLLFQFTDHHSGTYQQSI